jgi:predicted ATPase
MENSSDTTATKIHTLPSYTWQIDTLRIHSFRDFGTPETFIEFSSGINILLGANASGKSNLLRLIESCLNLNFLSFMNETFDVEFSLSSFGTNPDVCKTTIFCKAGNKQESNKDNESHFNFQMFTDFRFDNSDVHLSIEQLNLTAEVFLVRKDSSRELLGVRPVYPLRNYMELLLFLSNELLEAKNFLHKINYLWMVEQVKALGEWTNHFDDLSALLFSLTIGPTGNIGIGYSIGLGPKNLVLFLASNWSKSIQANPNNLSPSAEIESFTHPEFANLVVAQDETPPLRKALEILSATALIASPKNILSITPNENEQKAISYSGISFGLRFENGDVTYDSQFTPGQKRFISLVFSTMPLTSRSACKVPVLVDEIENGLHPRALDFCMSSLFNGRQVIVATHSPLVVDSLPEYDEKTLLKSIHVLSKVGPKRSICEKLSTEQIQKILARTNEHFLKASDAFRSTGIW